MSINVKFSWSLSLFFSVSQPSVLKVLLMADLPVFRHTGSVDEALQLLTGIIHYDQQFSQPITDQIWSRISAWIPQTSDDWSHKILCAHLWPISTQEERLWWKLLGAKLRNVCVHDDQMMFLHSVQLYFVVVLF